MKFESLSSEQQLKIKEYVKLLFLGNEKANLTAFEDGDEVLEKGVYPSLLAAGYLSGGTVADIGSGSGIPAVPLAIANCADRWVLLEPVGKKASFLEGCVSSLGLRAEVNKLTGEEFFSKDLRIFDGITVRGVKIRPRLMKLIRKRLKPGAPLLLWTGKDMAEFYGKELTRTGFRVSSQEEGRWGVLIVSVPCGT